MIDYKVNLSGQPVSNAEKKFNNNMFKCLYHNRKIIMMFYFFLYKLLNSKIICTQLLNKIHFRISQINTRFIKTFYVNNYCKFNFALNIPVNRILRFSSTDTNFNL